MKYVLNNTPYNVEIVRKNNKNTYIKVLDDLTILVTTNYFVSDACVLNLLDQNQKFLLKGLASKKEKQDFKYLGKKYNVIYVSDLKNVDIDNNYIYVKDELSLNKWLDKETKRIFKERLDVLIKEFNITIPKLKIRKMTTRWGVCNKKLHTITLNFNLIYYDIEKIDYVIIHELSHFLHFDHSKSFWQEVSKHCPNYKNLRKELRD